LRWALTRLAGSVIEGQKAAIASQVRPPQQKRVCLAEYLVHVLAGFLSNSGGSQPRRDGLGMRLYTVAVAPD
jgi:hypothetical protein